MTVEKGVANGEAVGSRGNGGGMRRRLMMVALLVSMGAALPLRAQEQDKPPDTDFTSVLKNLEKLKKPTPRTPQQPPTPQPPEQTAELPPSTLADQAISQSDKNSIRDQVSSCWLLQAGARDAANMAVDIRVRFNPDGSLQAPPQI